MFLNHQRVVEDSDKTPTSSDFNWKLLSLVVGLSSAIFVQSSVRHMIIANGFPKAPAQYAQGKQESRIRRKNENLPLSRHSHPDG